MFKKVLNVTMEKISYYTEYDWCISQILQKQMLKLLMRES